ncbi:MAG: hypothetical protein U9O96_04975 [Candidatus Thermoplasmatota archaeon]|nr:hypothetical protein [Candidatus Thermoplasmatota archaeon]
MIGDAIINFFSNFGVIGMVLALYVIFLIDSMIFPALPDFFLLVIYSTNPQNFLWGFVILIIAVFASFSGNSILYLIVKKYSPPHFIKNLMKKYSEMLIVKDERILLINRIAPVLPYTGAFIAINDWNYKKSIAYIVAGAIIKFGFLLLLSGTFYALFEKGVAQNATFILIIATIVISLIASHLEKGKLAKPKI